MPPKNIKTTYADNGGSTGGSTGGGGGGSSVLMYGSSGADVRRLQELLNSLGYNAGTPDGIFGAQTQAAVMQMQKDAGITADGIVGANTWNKISTATPVTNPPAVDVKAGAKGGEMGGITKLPTAPSTQTTQPTTPAAERVNTATGITKGGEMGGIQKLPDAPTTTNTNFNAAPEPEGGSAKADNTPKPGTTPVGEMATFQKLPDAPQSDISVPDYTSTLASLGIIGNAAQEKNQQYSGADIPDVKAGAKGGAMGGFQKLPDNPANTNQPTAEPPTYNPPTYNPPSSGASGTVQPYSGTGATGGAPTGGNSYNYAQNTQNGGGNVPAAPSGAENAGTVDPVLESYTAALNALDSTGTGDAGSPKYDDDLWALYEKITGRGPFRYDINEDMLYRQYAQQYTDQGRLAMEDAMGRAVALTGGYGSTYAQSVGQQTYDSYLQRLNEVIPELYDRRYQAWKDEGTQLERQYNLLGDLKDREAAAEAAAYEREIDARDYALKLSEIAREQGNLDRDYGLKEWQAIQDQNNELWNQGYKDRALAYDQYNADREFGLKQWSAEQDAYYQGLNYQLKQQELFYDQANADRNYELSLQKLLADIENDQKEKAVDIAEDPYQVMADTIAGLKQAGVRDGTEAYKVLLAQGMKDDQAKAYADMFESWSYDPSAPPSAPAWDPDTSTLAYGSGAAVHEDMTPMSSGFTDVWKNVRNMYDASKDKNSIATYLNNALYAGKITDHEVDIILDELGI